MVPKMNGPVISLYSLTGLALLVRRASGVLYTNRAGGNYCMQPVEEGVLVPLDDDEGHLQDKLDAFFQRRGGLLDASDADELDAILQTPEPPRHIAPTFFLEVDRDRLRDSMEAWLYVTVKACPDEHVVGSMPDGNGELSMISTLSGRRWHPSQQPELERSANLYPLTGFGRASAVLTWPNSD